MHEDSYFSLFFVVFFIDCFLKQDSGDIYSWGKQSVALGDPSNPEELLKVRKDKKVQPPWKITLNLQDERICDIQCGGKKKYKNVLFQFKFNLK